MECIARDQDFVEVSQRQRRRSCQIAGREGESLKRSDGRLVSRHLPFIAKQPGMGGDLTQVLRRPVELAAISRHSLVLSALACDERANLARVGKNHVRAVARHSRAD
jgi:hypothetical protein